MLHSDDPIAEAEGLIAAGRPHDAVALLQDLVTRGRGGLLLRGGLVRALIAAGRIDAALAGARDCATMYPNVAQTAVMLGEALLAAGHLPPAIGEFQRALRLDPGFAEARFRLGCAWLEAGEAEKAQEAFGAIDAAEHLPALAEKIAEAEAMRARTRSDPRYVRHLFDQFSADYDQRMLGQLGYGAPAILRGLADLVLPDLVMPERGRAYSLLDLGCGTGLGAAAFRDLASGIDGVDLSPAMIGKARATGIYRQLRVGDLETALDEGGRYDLIIAADTLVYLGDLKKVFAGARKSLVLGGTFLFTVEKKDGEGFELGPKRRWRHSKNYLRSEAAHAKFEIVGFLDCHPRTEAGQPVEGYAVAMR